MSSHPFHARVRRVVVTGGPGAGKTAVLELASRDLCAHVQVLPESASIVFGGGFPRRNEDGSRRCAQRAIYRVQAELEAMLALESSAVVGLCDRGTLDALAYWPGPWEEFFTQLGTTMDAEIARYDAVIHMSVPEDPASYRQSELRRETHREAREIDARLFEVWSRHPHRVRIDGTEDFLLKAKSALAALRAVVPLHRCTAEAGCDT